MNEMNTAPWLHEPNRLEFHAHGFPCLIVRNGVGALCGYVAVTPGHPAFEKHYDVLSDLDVHGGLTYADHCQGKICHVAKDDEPDNVWWLGFDCSHHGDHFPGQQNIMREFLEGPNFGGTYRTIEYVKKECKELARQLSEMKDFPNGA